MKKKIWIILASCVCVVSIVAGTTVYMTHSSSEPPQEPQSEAEKTPQPEKAKNIYGTMSSSLCWAMDPTIPEELMGKDGTVARIKVQNVGDAFFLPDGDPFTPVTPYEVEWLETLAGKEAPKQTRIYMRGGDVTVQSVVDQHGEQYAAKHGFTELDRAQWNHTYISYAFEDCDYRLQPGEEYTLVLVPRMPSSDMYMVMGNGYGVFTAAPVNTRSAGGAYQNVITGAVWNI